MDKIMIFGAGQGGRMISNWISSDYHLLGFIDNNSLLWDTKINNLKVYSLQEAVKMIPDIILVTVLNRDGALEIKKQLKEEGYEGKVFNINKFKGASNRAYYSIFHAIKAILALEQTDFKKHSSVIAYFNKEYISKENFLKN